MKWLNYNQGLRDGEIPLHVPVEVVTDDACTLQGTFADAGSGVHFSAYDRPRNRFCHFTQRVVLFRLL